MTDRQRANDREPGCCCFAGERLLVATFAGPHTKKRTGPEARADAQGGKSLMIGEPVLLDRHPMLSFVETQSRYRIWSVQNRSRRCSDLLRVANSSLEMPPTCSTVLTCF
jgi:hypothetical protein